MLELRCTICKGPFHPATGHYESVKRHWCGVCTRSLIALLKEYAPRKWGGIRFYDLATVPPTIAPNGWRPEDLQLNDVDDHIKD